MCIYIYSHQKKKKQSQQNLAGLTINRPQKNAQLYSFLPKYEFTIPNPPST